ncbi:FkbM family methyltransferase [Candidatus Methylacidiphilum infernorum]|uniref:SAM-dependent methyltransferase n=1 Tax=Methylacidiphilum infernorum (isolate V4) TaxID=481448 RepID=B3DZW9_METI4|nr:FkbM family methyltransferase [Candidatus Methylacidiphilum infernorum]ACD82630.1 SAM-dependent methyltransferase [Methylacidiphilum infernorum V4]
MAINQIPFRPLSWIKRGIIAPGRSKRRVIAGLFKGLDLELDLSCQMQVLLGLWETETYGFIRKCAQRSRWMVDVGAGTGELVSYFLKQKLCKKVYAIEPQKDSVDILRRNANNNLSGKEIEGRLFVITQFLGCNVLRGELPLDSLSLDRTERGFLKIDVDGAELGVLKSGENLLATGRVDLLVETHSSQLEISCFEFLTGLGYRPSVIKNAWWRLFVPEQRPTEHNRWLCAEAKNDPDNS